MAIISFSKDTVVDYVPEYGDNRVSSAPCVIRLRFIPFGEARELMRAQAAKSKGANTQEKVMAISQALQKEKFVSHIDGVSGYFVDGKEVTSSEEFYETASGALIFEVLEAMEDSAKLSEGQKKNSERAFVGASS